MSASQSRTYFKLQLAAHLLKKKADAILIDSTSLTAAQTAVMAIVSGHDGISQRAIAASLMQRESAISTMSDRLLKAGYITRARSKSDQRAWVLTATRKGRDALELSQRSFREINRLIDKCLSTEEARVLSDGLSKIIDALSICDDDPNHG